MHTFDTFDTFVTIDTILSLKTPSYLADI